eukprot:CAMPEP_0174852200 /NCGR_PEP_ID=MMETSP1114-20130205/25240_1 /TAXON_ID=312471 /ORGANISM="Neobodo designis, Strain CCAP 1951/1" /LENGTH=190 /DNA_ID=CAMNT_0016086779 /DNA_START=452 /DNA_END=1021 /DNA_ORIENTATION=-
MLPPLLVVTARREGTHQLRLAAADIGARTARRQALLESTERFLGDGEEPWLRRVGFRRLQLRRWLRRVCWVARRGHVPGVRGDGGFNHCLEIGVVRVDRGVSAALQHVQPLVVGGVAGLVAVAFAAVIGRLQRRDENGLRGSGGALSGTDALRGQSHHVKEGVLEGPNHVVHRVLRREHRHVVQPAHALQ